MTKKLSIVLLLAFTISCNTLLANYENYKIAVYIDNSESQYDNFYKEIIESVLIENGLNVFNRDISIDEIIKEGHEDSLNNDVYSDLKKESITHIALLSIREINKKYICIISIKNISTYETENSASEIFDNLNIENISNLSSQLCNKITGNNNYYYNTTTYYTY